MAEFTASIWFSYEANSYAEANQLAKRIIKIATDTRDQLKPGVAADADIIDVELIDGEVTEEEE